MHQDDMDPVMLQQIRDSLAEPREGVDGLVDTAAQFLKEFGPDLGVATMHQMLLRSTQAERENVVGALAICLIRLAECDG